MARRFRRTANGGAMIARDFRASAERLFAANLGGRSLFMKLYRSVVLVCALLAGLAVASPANAQPRLTDRPGTFADDDHQTKSSLIGTWDLVITFSDGSQVKSVLSVLPGRNGREGSVIHAAEASLLLPNPTTAEQGTWEQVRRGKYIATYYGFAVDSTFSAPAGRIGFKHRIEIAPDGESFTGIATFEVLDSSGAVVFADAVTTSGKRQHPVTP